MIGFLGGDVGELPIVKIRENWLNSTQVAEWVRDKRSLLVITPSTLNDALRKNYGSALLHNVFVEPHTPGGIQHYSFHHLFRSEFQAHLSERRTKHASSPLLRAVAKGWSIGVDQVDVWTVEFDIGARDTVLVDAKQIRHPECDEE